MPSDYKFTNASLPPMTNPKDRFLEQKLDKFTKLRNPFMIYYRAYPCSCLIRAVERSPVDGGRNLRRDYLCLRGKQRHFGGSIGEER